MHKLMKTACQLLVSTTLNQHPQVLAVTRIQTLLADTLQPHIALGKVHIYYTACSSTKQRRNLERGLTICK